MSNIFERYLFEADGDPPDINDTANNASDTSEDQSPDEGPPDMGSDFGDGSMDNTNDEFGPNDFDDMDNANDNQDQQEQPEELHLSDKVSAINNNKLYQRFLSMLNNISSQISATNENNDILFSMLGDGYTEIQSSYKKLEENIRLYLKYNFMNEDYGKNLLFFNKCLNLLNLVNESFEEQVKKYKHDNQSD